MLIRRLESTPDLVAHAPPEARRSVVAFKHQNAVSKADFSKPYEAKAAPLPLVETPILIAKLKVGTPKPGVHALTFVPKEGQAITLTLPDQAVHSFGHLMEKIVKKAHWGFDFNLQDHAVAVPPPGTRLM